MVEILLNENELAFNYFKIMLGQLRFATYKVSSSLLQTAMEG